MKWVYTLSIFPAFKISASQIEYLWSLTLLLLDFTLSNRDLHFSFTKALHGWSNCSSIIWCCGGLIRISVSGCTLTISGLCLECIFDLLHQLLVAFNMCHQIEFVYWVRWNIRCFVLEATMHKNILEVLCPNWVPESLDRIEFFPFWVLCLIYLH